MVRCIYVYVLPKFAVYLCSFSWRAEKRAKLYCEEHGEEVGSFCKQCQKPVCPSCVVHGARHYGHQLEETSEVLDITELMHSQQEQLGTINNTLPDINVCATKIEQQELNIKAKIQDAASKLHAHIDEREKALISQLQQITEEKLKTLKAQKELLETAQAQLSTSLQKVQQLRDQFQKEIQPNTEADINFYISTATATVCMNYGQLSTTREETKEDTCLLRPLQTLDEVKDPWAVAINQQDEVVVTGWGTQCISILSRNGRSKPRFIGTGGDSPGEFKDPTGVVILSDGSILVTDNKNHRIQKFTADGQFQISVGSEGVGPLQFNYPRAIICNLCNNKIYVVDGGNQRVQKLNSDLTFSSSFGEKGSEEGQFDYPRDIACDSTGNVYVADSNNHRIQVFTPEGRFLRTFGGHGEGRGELMKPAGVAIDASSMVYVSEQDNYRISMFTTGGDFVTSFGKYGQDPGEFESPRYLATDSSGVLYVCDKSNRVQLFHY